MCRLHSPAQNFLPNFYNYMIIIITALPSKLLTLKVANPPSRTAHSLRCPYQRQNARFWHFVCIPWRVHSKPLSFMVVSARLIWGFTLKVANPPSRTAHSLRCPYQRQNARFWHFVCIPWRVHSKPLSFMVVSARLIWGFTLKVQRSGAELRENGVTK